MAAAGGDNIFVYTGGEQEVPLGVRHVRIDRSVKIIPREALYYRIDLVYVETHEAWRKSKDLNSKDATL